jgi:OPA family glycerol-3-phosphate transporter-like MFS transporter
MSASYPLFRLLWLVYFASNMGRLSYTACMIDIISREGVSLSSAGLAVTGFFTCYGLGQIGSGYIGGRISPFKLIFIGLFCTALANLAMGFAHTGAFMFAVWCFNGLAQSVIWPPVLRIIVECFPEPARSKACVNISTTYPIAVMFTYLSCAGIITVLSWKAVFFIYSSFLFAVSAVWILAVKKIIPVITDERICLSKKHCNFFTAPAAAVALFCLALVAQGALRDGLMTWIPAYTAGVFSLPSNAAILSAGFIPLVNLAGIYMCRLLFSRIKDEGKTSVCLFGVSSLAALVLRFAGEYHMLVSLSAFAVITGCMAGVNLMLVTFVPARFSRFGLVPFMTGLTNSMVYLGSSVSTFGIASLVEKTGWGGIQTLSVILAAAGALFCVTATPRWTVFTKPNASRTGR